MSVPCSDNNECNPYTEAANACLTSCASLSGGISYTDLAKIVARCRDDEVYGSNGLEAGEC